MTGAAGTETVVGVGDCRIAAFQQKGRIVTALSTYALGSCIAVIVYDWQGKIGGMLHLMLPDSTTGAARAEANPYLYADTGVPALFRGLIDLGATRQKMRCHLVGGSCMMADSSHFEIGKKNYLAVRKSLWKLGVFVDHEDIGGSETRSVRLDLETGRIDLRKGAARGIVFAPAGIHTIGRIKNNALADR